MHLTFDDGPIPEVTPWVRRQLATCEARATFFCVGHHIEQHPDIYARVLEAGHLTGNHTYNHLDGWTTDPALYFRHIGKAEALIGNGLFRPPYGHLRPSARSAARYLQKQDQVVLWDVLSGDFDPRVSREECLQAHPGQRAPRLHHRPARQHHGHRYGLLK